MFSIDQFAYTNRLRQVHPQEKLLLAGMSMALVILRPLPLVSGLVLLLMTGLLSFQAGIPFRYLWRLLLLPVSFLLLSLWTLLLQISTQPLAGVSQVWQLGPFYFGLDWQQLGQAGRLLLQALAAISCLYFLILTTPIVEILAVLRRLHFPPLLLELMGLVYRFIFVLAEAGAQIYISQSARWGYAGLANSYRSLGQLVAALLLKSQQRSRQLYQALEARGYQGELKVMEPDYHRSRVNLALILLVQLILWAVAWHGGGEQLVSFYS